MLVHPPTELSGVFGFGVAGNFAGHLEQAGEAGDFAHVLAEEQMPKGIFPWYVPGSQTFLGAYPLSTDRLAIPPAAAAHNIQIEPELGVLFAVERDDSGTVTALHPRWCGAFDDCSLRRPGAKKISEKKNWGEGSKGIAARGWAIDSLEPAGPLASLRLACFLRRDGATHAYGVDSAIPSYTLFGDALIDWLVERLAKQRASEETPLEDVGSLLAVSGCSQVLVGVGASRYEPFGETTYVQAGDEAIVVVYDAHAHPPDALEAAIVGGTEATLESASVLCRRAVSLPG